MRYLPNECFEKKLSNGKVLLTTRFGDWIILSEKDLRMFRRGEVNDDLLKKLEERNIVITEGNITRVLKNIIKRLGYIHSMPMMTVQINLTLRCNLACRYCHAESSPERFAEMDGEVMRDCVRFVEKLPKKYIGIEFQGGEPFLRFDLMQEFLQELEGKVRKKGKRIVRKIVVSNGTLIDKDIARWAAKNGINISISLDGPKEIHDKHRMYPNGHGTYEDVICSIRLLEEVGAGSTSTATITRHTMENGGADAVIKEYLRWKRPFIFYRPVMNAGRAQSNEELFLGAEDFLSFVKGSIHNIVKLKKRGIRFRDKFVEYYLKNVFTTVRQYSCLRDICGAGITHLTIAPDGIVYPCDSMKTLPEFSLGSVRDPYEKIYINLLQSMIYPQDVAVECPFCPYIGFCGFCKRENYGVAKSMLPYHFISEDCRFKKLFFTYIFENIEFFRDNFGKLISDTCGGAR